MDVVISPMPHTAAERAGARVAEAIAANPLLVLGVATGSSPLGVYAHVRERIERHGLDVSGITCFALDEYVGLPEDHPQSYHQVIRQTVTEPWGLRADQVHVPAGTTGDPRQAALDYERDIREAGGVGLQLVGIGGNGHIGFNEPGSSLGSRTRIKTLHPRTREDNARFFGGDMDAVPIHCITQGIATILDAGHVLMIASGAGKADAVAKMVEGPVSSACPASALQLHPHTEVFIDDAAAAGLLHRDYYDFAVANADSVPGA
ncbi:glucosamine-6-phosphate deaminase [Galactobacter caseinivorans]|uniref:Glucosamine-6-phosphate deaminase n=1 Tax=Galactobacter caseinivorans TaxID=2676123 RepID=A0A496PGP5_9MICC|nr:glucosamine-6-phosphate deaminase [Galactobacter caseinivorans]RKW69649.1 glucosamine-6-phosphate deaminase [Galactobacter caseinivorans]